MHTKILVLGGTGMLGKPVVGALRERGFPVRVMVRDIAEASGLFDEDVELVKGDITLNHTVKRAIDGCSGVHISIGGPVDHLSAEQVTGLAPSLGVRQITYISGSTVCEANGWFPMTAQKLLAETAVRGCGIPYTIFCPTWPMEQLARFAGPPQVTVVGTQRIPWHWFAAADLGRMVARAYGSELALGKRLYVHGPEALSIYEALTRFCEVFRPDIEQVLEMPVAAARQLAAETDDPGLTFVAELMGYFEKVGEPGDPTEANQLLGGPKTTLNDWMVARAAEMPEVEVIA